MHLRVPTLFISGLSDTLVPPRMMVDLHNRCGSARKQLLQFQSGTHNETWTVHGYYHALALFLQNCRVQNEEGTLSLSKSNSTKAASENVWHNVHDI